MLLEQCIKSMDLSKFQIETQGEHKIIVGHIFRGDEIEVGSKWISVGTTSPVTIEKVTVDEFRGETLYEVHYSWKDSKGKQKWQKESFAFQCRYCLIVH